MRLLALFFLMAAPSMCQAEEGLRSGPPKDCYLYSWGKGPNWTAKVSTEFQLSVLGSKMPYIDDRYSDPTEKALSWVDRKQVPVTTTIAVVDGREVIQVVYPEAGAFGKTIGTILVAIETARDSEWFAPFFGAQPELYRSQFVSGRDVTFGYIATLEWSRTGAFRTHLLFDLKKPHPVILIELGAGRVVRNEFETDLEYEDALKIFDQEAQLLSGTIPKATRSKSSNR